MLTTLKYVVFSWGRHEQNWTYCSVNWVNQEDLQHYQAANCSVGSLGEFFIAKPAFLRLLPYQCCCSVQLLMQHPGAYRDNIDIRILVAQRHICTAHYMLSSIY